MNKYCMCCNTIRCCFITNQYLSTLSNSIFYNIYQSLNTYSINKTIKYIHKTSSSSINKYYFCGNTIWCCYITTYFFSTFSYSNSIIYNSSILYHINIFIINFQSKISIYSNISWLLSGYNLIIINVLVIICWDDAK